MTLKSKLQVIALGLHIFERAVRRTYEWMGYIQGASKQATDQNSLCIYCFLIKPQNVMINQIHFNTFGGGLISIKAYNLIYILIQFPFVLFVLFAVNLPLCFTRSNSQGSNKRV